MSTPRLAGDSPTSGIDTPGPGKTGVSLSANLTDLSCAILRPRGKRQAFKRLDTLACFSHRNGVDSSHAGRTLSIRKIDINHT